MTQKHHCRYTRERQGGMNGFSSGRGKKWGQRKGEEKGSAAVIKEDCWMVVVKDLGLETGRGRRGKRETANNEKERMSM